MERIVVNMGPQHPSTHGVLRLILETEETVVVSLRNRYLHTESRRTQHRY